MGIKRTGDFISKVKAMDWLVLPSGLHVPPAAFLQRQMGAPGEAVYTTLGELRGRPATLAEIAGTLRKVSVYEALQALSYIALCLENHDWFNKDLQQALVQGLLPARYRDAAARILLTEPHRFVFFEQQILSLMQLAVLYCPETSQASLQADPRLFDEFVSTCILGISDQLESTYLRSARGRSAQSEPRAAEPLTAALLRNAFFNYRDLFQNMLARATDLYLELPKKLAGSPNYVDIEAAFAQAAGVPLDVYLAVGFGVACQFMQASGKVGQHDPRKFAIDPAGYFRTTSLSGETIHRCLLQLSSDLPSYRRRLKDEIKRTRQLHYSFITMRQSPILRLPNDIYIPLSFRFLQERMTVGVYWPIHDQLQGEDRKRFQRFFGELFQRYTQEVLGGVYPNGAGLVKRIHFATGYGTSAQPKETSDILILYGQDVVFIEVKASRLKMEDSAIRGDIQAFRKDINDKVIAAARQIHRVVRDFVAGEFTLDGFEGKDMRRAYPVVLTFGYFPQTPPTWREIERMLDAEGLLKAEHFRPLQLMTVDELEMLEGYLQSGGALTLLDILERKANDPHHRFFPMKTYLSYKVPATASGNERIAQRLEQLQSLTIDVLGLEDSSAGLPEGQATRS